MENQHSSKYPKKIQKKQKKTLAVAKKSASAPCTKNWIGIVLQKIP